MPYKHAMKQNVSILHMVQKSPGKKQEERQRPYIPVVKKVTKGKDRAAVREAIAHERYEDIPRFERMKKEDPWAWD